MKVLPQKRIISLAAFALAGLLIAGGGAWAEEPAQKKEAPADAEKKQSAKSPYEKASRPKTEKKKEEKVRVYTNADLRNADGSMPDPDAPQPAPAQPDGQQPTAGKPGEEQPSAEAWVAEQRKRQAAIGQRIAAAEAEVNTARALVANLEKQLLAISNPFSARPQLSEEEMEKRRTERVPDPSVSRGAGRHGSESPLERKERTQKQLDEARERLRQAEQALVEARTKR